MDTQYGYPLIRKNITYYGTRIRTKKQKEVAHHKKRTRKNIVSIRQIRDNSNPARNIHQQKRSHQNQNMSRSAYEKNRKKTSPQRQGQ